MAGTPERVSPHFSLAELTATDHRAFLEAQAAPSAEVRDNLERLARLCLEPARMITGPLRVNSGWRCRGLNEAIGGAPGSAHLYGRAADLVPLYMDIREAYLKIAGAALPIDQLIFERPAALARAWIHIAIAPCDVLPRRALLAMYAPGSYRAWDPRDPEFERGA